MKRLVLFAIALAACKRTPPPSETDATAPVVTAEPKAASDAGARKAPPTIKVQPPLPAASETLALVAVGQRIGSKVISFQAHGDHVWLSAVDLDAHAEGDAPLAKGPDPLAKLPYDPKKHRVDVVGRWPDLFVLRTRNETGRIEPAEPAVFVKKGDAWKAAKRLPITDYPKAFVAWNGGALFVGSELVESPIPGAPPRGLGTSLAFVDAEGNVSRPKIGLPRLFTTWRGHGDGERLALIGTVWSDRSKADAGDYEPGGKGVFVARTSGDGKSVTTTKLFDTKASTVEFDVPVREQGDVAIAFRPNDWEFPWQGSPVWTVGPDGAKPRTVPVDGTCTLADATIAGGVLYLARHCMLEDGSRVPSIARVAPDGHATEVKLPSLAKAAGGGFRLAKAGDETTFVCSTRAFVARGSDLWVRAECGGDGTSDTPTIPAVFRLGRPQEPVIIP